MVQDSKPVVTVTAQACIYGAIILLAVPVRWFISWVLALICHELFHCLALILCGKTIDKISIGAHGAKIQTSLLHPGETIFCALAGPLGGFLLVLLGRFFPQLAVCALIQTVFNLLPIYPLDGGRALLGFLHFVVPGSRTNGICNIIEAVIVGLLFVISFFAAIFWKLGLIPLLVTTVLAGTWTKEKFLANGAFSRYNSATKINEVRL